MFDKLISNNRGHSCAIASWVLLVGGGIAYLTAYSQTPGHIATPPDLSSELSAILLASDSASENAFTLVLALHPRCPCSRASIGELERLLTKCGDSLSTTVLAYLPASVGVEWLDTDTVNHARRLPRTRVLEDEEGTIAENLGMTTSGSVVLYNSLGEPLFYGGITAARNHHGDNVGSDAIRALVAGHESLRTHSSVYGCPISEPNQALNELPCGDCVKE